MRGLEEGGGRLAEAGSRAYYIEVSLEDQPRYLDEGWEAVGICRPYGVKGYSVWMRRESEKT